MENEEKREEQSAQSGGAAGKAIGVIIVVVIIAIAAFAYEQHAKQKTETAMVTPPPKKVSAQPTNIPPTQSMLKDGTYTAEGDYVTHVGQKSIQVTITIKKDIITNADVVGEADDEMSVHFQDSFISGYKPEVIGKDITTVHLTKVAESSLTPNGFNDALAKIEKQAQS